MSEVDLPEELAPALRHRARALLEQVPPAPDWQPGRDRRPSPSPTRPRCYVCHEARGRMGGHHVVPGDDSTVVPIHPSCHRKLHRR